MKKIVIASQNPVKIAAVTEAFKKMFPEENYLFQGIYVPSGVSDQPMSDVETFTGAHNRAEKALEIVTDADFSVGIEGGVEKEQKEIAAIAWVVVLSIDKKMGKAKTGTFYLPQKVSDLIRDGKELGEATDIVFKSINSKHKNGTVGILTDDLITRTIYYEEAVILALIPFKNKDF